MGSFMYLLLSVLQYAVREEGRGRLLDGASSATAALHRSTPLAPALPCITMPPIHSQRETVNGRREGSRGGGGGGRGC